MKWSAILCFWAYVALPLTWGTVRPEPLAAVISVMIAVCGEGVAGILGGDRHESGELQELDSAEDASRERVLKGGRFEQEINSYSRALQLNRTGYSQSNG
ncbi:hypothetical protein K456DRAFT_1165602 [Colletotrichum gloeosporioides 23]|nr:hypothetical protein K456DRAFT_1165602 [Colletotrichum gloeosporioides 23]